MRAFSCLRQSISQQQLYLFMQRLQRKGLGQYRSCAGDGAAGFVYLDGVAADEQHLEVRAQCGSRFDDHRSGYAARTARAGSQQIKGRPDPEELAVLGRVLSVKFLVAFAREVIAQQIEKMRLGFEDQNDFG